MLCNWWQAKAQRCLCESVNGANVKVKFSLQSINQAARYEDVWEIGDASFLTLINTGFLDFVHRPEFYN
jgi:hypothetical protein